MRLLCLLPLTLLTACVSSPTELDPLSYQCQQQLDAYREQPALRDSRDGPLPLPIAPVSAECRKELSSKGVDVEIRR
ncbi:hypothetical protein C1924_02060 [Stenotrophomonas sp. ESTM1D_MKCIP4_1]|uniref:hypothetical protein n=1 Tax=Stenotrophomonas sp. ESTM1D_MKCIP4_1 TaxID=2072414 RepID=UPI000D53CCEC|nr:hypothetical protein [Stenotrophomonas sp. ESTM1D_MKCIP4_1]AWH52056.1 hypothetical protein C1924_02060 [Stenotrophomonas sp. ESTM1D_MKCIP4_1]